MATRTSAVEGLEPAPFWEHFEALTRIARPSRREEPVIEHVRAWAAARGLELRQDAGRNLVIRVPATPGRESAPTVILQGHLDMVCERQPDSPNDPAEGRIELLLNGEWLTADGTTLGADDGVAIAAMMTLVEDESLTHGPLELLMTVAEEVGLEGANALDGSLLSGTILLNLDSEEDGKLTVGCAGSTDTWVRVTWPREASDSGAVTLALTASGGLGGHSGTNIQLGRANAVKLLARALREAYGAAPFRLVSLDGGKSRNAIPRDARAVCSVGPDGEAAFRAAVEKSVATPVSPSTRLSAAFTPRTRVGAALDLCAGAGAHALLAARHAERVVATDLSARAVELTRLNAALNDLANIETRAGSFLEPVSAERFDLVVANPPYVISPDRDFLYRDAGLPGDELSRAMLAELPRLLKQDGYGCLQGNWVHGGDEPWYRPLQRGLRGAGCDALLVRYATWSPLAYATAWCAPHHADDPDELREAVNRWRTSFTDAGIEAISGAIVVMHRRAGPRHWCRAFSLADVPAGLGERLPRIVGANTRLADRDDPLSARLRPAPGLDVERRQRPGEHERTTLNCPAALVTRRPVEPALADQVLRLDGMRTLGEVLDDRTAAASIAALLKLGLLDYADDDEPQQRHDAL